MSDPVRHRARAMASNTVNAAWFSAQSWTRKMLAPRGGCGQIGGKRPDQPLADVGGADQRGEQRFTRDAHQHRQAVNRVALRRR